ncbi:hypothetical protein RJ639_025215 [Escallonia herrerae]|uniref:Pectin acetylesterase n=1 Tax=Escallonia herrerae TaxID=1293975 RepID=A0AA89ABT8_9ASTE|nr:hypothetical protein RJ639_025215 [Escallonia herrerae]
MVNAALGQRLFIHVCLLILWRTESSSVDITIVEDALAKGAVCSDGSPSAYQYAKGVGEGINNWLVHLEGGAWCESVERCTYRAGKHVGSSKYMTGLNFTGILNNKKKFNPDFYNWNRILVRYCDGSSFTGDVEEVDPATMLHFRGARIFRAVMEELLAKGMENASNALLTGCSAGGLATILHCDNFRNLLPSSTKVKCVSDAGYFIHAKDYAGGNSSADFFQQVVELHVLSQLTGLSFLIFNLIISVTRLQGSAKNLPPWCTSIMKPSLIENIMAPKRADPCGSWKFCKFNIYKCSPAQAKTWQDFRQAIIRALAALGRSSSRGMFINSCHTHCQTTLDSKWYGPAASRLMNKTIGEAVGDWYYGRSGFQQIDHGHDWPQLCVFDPSEHPKDYLSCTHSSSGQ